MIMLPEKALADELCLYDEELSNENSHTIFDPNATWKRKTLTNFTAKPLHKEIFKSGELVYKSPSTKQIRSYCLSQVDMLWDEVKRFENPHKYYVDLSYKLWNTRQELLNKKI